MTNPVPNMQAAVVKVKNGLGYLLPPWNSFFQQFVQLAPAPAAVTNSPFTANAYGTVIFTGVAPTSITLTRGSSTLNVTGEKIIPVSIGDSVTWTGFPTAVQFLGA